MSKLLLKPRLAKSAQLFVVRGSNFTFNFIGGRKCFGNQIDDGFLPSIEFEV